VKTKIEGIVLTKNLQGERNLVVKLLLRSGKVTNVIFYGGRGGGEKKKSSVLELGTMLKVELARSRVGSDLSSAKEWEAIWMADKLRLNHIAFYLLCSIVQVASKVAQEEDLHDESHGYDEHSAGVFRAISNSLVHLEHSVASNTFYPNSELCLFLGKLLIELGVFPDLRTCMICGVALEQFSKLSISSEHGGFVCSNCTHGDHAQHSLWLSLNDVAAKKSPEIVFSSDLPHLARERLWQYFCFQSNLDPKDFRTIAMIP